MRKVSLARRLTAYALLIALQIILTRFLSIQTPIVRVSFFFVPIALSAILFGPLVAGMLAGVSDVMGFFLNPVGTFHPGFILSAILTGVVYGLFLNKKEVTWFRIGLAALVISLGINLGLNSFWLSQILGKGVWGLLISRVIKEAIMFLIQIPIIMLVWQALKKPLRRYQVE